MKYYLDENLSQVSAKIARDAGIDVTSSHEVGMDGRLDLEQVRFAAADGRVLVTHDLGDMGKALAELADRGEQHAGVLFIPRSIRVDDFAGVARAVQRWEEEHPEGMPVGFVGYVRNPRLTR